MTATARPKTGPEAAREPIAIIGVGLRLPQADGLDAFWRHLAAGRSLISEVPPRRWDAEALRGDPARENKTGSIWGGFLEDADCFDAAFFNISPREAAWMDPQQRFVLETAWHALEDAGYPAAALAGSRTGVYVGTCHWDYAELLEKHLTQLDAYTPTGIAFSILANRVSHFFDFHGPSIANDTACAAAMTSVYQAVRALQEGECDQALAGGVNLIWSPNHFIAFSKAGMLSKEGCSKAFDEAADGYVRGEGAAMLLLKPLARALADGDPIHAVIRGVGVNHGGRTNSLTVTNPKAQAALLVEVHRAAGVTPDTLGYIEAHGPGTPLGDPIEIAGLKEGFAALHAEAGTTPRPESCGIGSVKTNIGHLEGAAGVAGIVKVLAALRHEALPPNVGFETLNRLIDFSGTAFRIQDRTTPWPRTPGRPRRAGVNAFGFGGSNAHVLLEEAPEIPAPTAAAKGPAVVPLSARDEDRLSAYARALLAFVEADGGATALADLAHTLQVGREAMEARLCILASDPEGLCAALRAFLAGEGHSALHRAGDPPEGDEGPAGLAARWLAGEAVDWAVLADRASPPRRVRAPLYPFARERHWMDESLGGKDSEAVPHPLLHRNISGFDGPRHRSLLKGGEFFWAEHRVGGRQVLPGVAYLEMARAAAALAGVDTASAFAFENLVWSRPILAGDAPVAVELSLRRQADGGLAFAVETSDIASGGLANGQGSLRTGGGDAPWRDIAALRAAAGQEIAVADCYARLRESGVAHGPTFQALGRVRRGPEQVVAQLKLPRRLLPSLAAMPLHPVLLDAAIQAWVALDDGPPEGAAVPFACRRVEVFGACTPSMWALVRATPEARAGGAVRHLDIELCDKDGKVCVAFHDLALRVMAPADAATEAADPAASGALILTEGAWEARPLAEAVAPVPVPVPVPDPARESTVLLAGIDAALADRVGGTALALPPPDTGDVAATAQAWFTELHRRLAALMRAKPRWPQAVLVVAPADLPACLTAPLAALLRTAAVEHPKLGGRVVTLAGALSGERLAEVVAGETAASDAFAEVRYDAEGARRVWRPVAAALPAPAAGFRAAGEGAYWITGGLGGLGLIFAGWLAERGARRIVLSGRRAAPDVAGEAAMARLRARGAEVRYLPCDLADAGQVAAVAAEAGPLRGVIHAAGLLDDGFILTQDPAAFAPVFAPKVDGLVNLDAATRDLALDFMLLCSSVAAPFGNAGQAVYAAANAFMEAFAEQRAGLVARGERQGTTVALAWPLWAEGGMTVDAPSLEALKRRFGTLPLPTVAGLEALERVLSAGQSGRCGVLYGEAARIGELLEAYGEAAPATPDDAPEGRSDDAELTRRTVAYVRGLLAEVLQMDPARIRANRKLEEYGLDSIVIVETTNRLEEALGPLSKTLFFEYVDLEGIAGHLVEEQREALLRALGPAEDSAPALAATRAAGPRLVAAPADPAPDEASARRPDDRHDIAIVGLSLRVAKAADQQAFWEMLSHGIDGFEPYPASRWNHAALLHSERDVLGKTVVRTGAFLDDVDKFDPRYFRISQAEAELMSPEVRLFLEASVAAFEDAGYSREYIQARYGGEVAVIVGSMTNEYDLYGFQNMLLRGSLASGSYTGTLPNMVSYFYGLTGPSYFLDTMCSASSTCVHEAVHMLRAGRCKMALAGGVSLLLHPQKLIATSQEHFTTKTADVIRGYGLGADGTILGEGVGALVLKPLADAERDGDHIYGVITGSGLSNAGIRNGFTVPNPAQQALAIERALEDAGIDARTIGYVEGHGSGTALGDPIEIKALTQAFAKYTAETGFCPIGTVKSNVAHLLAASGLAGIVKVLMQLRHGQLAPSLHAETLNPDIPFGRTPFYVQRDLAPWPRLGDESGRELPRRAGVTSIGAGGINSHIIVEEYRPPDDMPPHDMSPLDGPVLLVFSAMGEGALAKVVERFCAHLRAEPAQSLRDVAYTLQVGRNELPCRLALTVPDRQTALARLAAFLAAPGAGEGWLYCRSILDADPPEDAAHLHADLRAGALERVATAWLQGAAVDWDLLHETRRPRRVSLPAYPFERVRCWVAEEPDGLSVVQPLGARLKLHPFVGSNRSGLEGLRYATPIHLRELLDYGYTRARKAALLPTATAEIGLALARIAGLSGPLALRRLTVDGEVAWEEVAELACRLEPRPGIDGGWRVAVETLAPDGAHRPWFAADLEAEPAPATVTELPLATVRTDPSARCDGSAFYAELARHGLGFAPYLEVVEQAWRLPDGWLCSLRRDPPQQDAFKKNVQVPAAALGAAFQGLVLAAPAGQKVAAIDRAWRGEGEIEHVLVRRVGGGETFDLLFAAADGRVVGGFEGVRLGAAAARLPVPPQGDASLADDPTAGLGRDLRELAGAILKFPAAEIGARESFHDLGFDSISLSRFANDIAAAYDIDLSPAIFFECEHIAALSAHLAARHGIRGRPQAAVAQAGVAQVAARPVALVEPAPAARDANAEDDRVAIVGMAGRFPGSPDVESFFDNLLAGRDLIGDLPLERYGPAYRERIRTAGFVPRGGFLEDIDRFDAALFKISPLEAARLDPQQRLMLETAWRALEDAGYRPEELPADTGVFVGVTSLDYAALLQAHEVPCDGYVATGNSLAMVANRLSHALNLNGPSQAIDTACSSSLIALLRAAEALRGGRCGAALVGGVNLCLAVEGFEGPQRAGMLSPEGRCKTFGAGADGYVRGEGVAVLLLKRLGDARRDGDRILGLLAGGAENHGGRAGSLTAPNAKAQAALIERAMAGLDPRTVSYIEAHGTGTSLGDPVEVNGLKRAYETLLGGATAGEAFIGLGTVKSAIGHLEAAAGLAGVVKVLMAMRRGELPPSLHCETVSPHIALDGSPFRLVRRREAWPRRSGPDGRELPRCAGVSSFGFGGANAHVVLEEAPIADVARPPAAQRAPLPPRPFAATRFWLPGVGAEDELVLLTPTWREAALPVGGAPVGGQSAATRRIVLPCEIEVAPWPGVEVRRAALPDGDIGRRYAAMAAALLAVLREALAEPAGAPLCVQLAVPRGDERELYAGLGAMLDTAAAENPRIVGQVVEVPAAIGAGELARVLAAEAEALGTGAGNAQARDARVRHSEERRWVRGWQTMPEAGAHRWRDRGVTLIAGGMGALGRLVARDIARTTREPVLVLAGTAPLDEVRSAFLDELRGLGAVAGYRQVDLADAAAVAGLVGHVLEVHGALHAVVHCAGVLRDGYIPAKTDRDLAAVLAPKVAGTLALHRACAGLELDSFLLFSSLAGAVGNAGQADYAAANGFLDALACRQGGAMVAVNWPLWREGGMTVDAATEDMLFRRIGQRPLASGQGLVALHRVLAARVPQAAAVAGDGARIRAFFGLPAEAERPETEQAVKDESGGRLLEAVTTALGRLFARVGGFADGGIEPRRPLEDYGIDSLMITRLNVELDEIFGPLPKTLFFQYRTLAEVAGYLAERHPEGAARWVRLPAAAAPAVAAAMSPDRPMPGPVAATEPIAVIGLSGRYPDADDPDAFWANLLAGHDAVGEIPAERWPLEGFYHPDPDEAVAHGLSYAKWGAFLDGFADFDPLFFKIAPREAAAMDPQERLFLMCAWAACEDAGYSPARLRAVAGGEQGARVGVFVGVTKTGFALHGPFAAEGGATVRPTTSFAGIANRVSHAFDLVGPSLPVDTMCSSSLTAIHEACAHLRAGACAMALAGGVNLYLHPSTYRELSAARMLSPDGRCRSFGAGGNGFVPGEGVGCVLLKPLSRALADGDRIHAVIRGSAVNHGGRTNGYTVPNPAAQRDVVRAALAQAGLSARAVGYLEAHGTGTELGDPIEVAGLTEAFRADSGDSGYCALGSVKSGIGHLEAAAGIAGLTKVILQMRHRRLAPTLNAARSNPNIDFAETPFVLQREAAPWTAEGPRVAGISSFGAGGANAHVIVEEWPQAATIAAEPAAPQAVILSARDPERLRAQAERLLAYLERPRAADRPGDLAADLGEELAALLAVAPSDLDPAESFEVLGLGPGERLIFRRRLEERFGVTLEAAAFAHLDSLARVAAHLQGLVGSPSPDAPPALADIAYSLQVGREAMACRLGLVVADLPALRAGLCAWLEGDETYPGLYDGQGDAQRSALAPLLGDDSPREMAARWWADGRLDDILRLWVAGLEVDWTALPRPVRPNVVSLPTYPFARQRFWIPQARGAAPAEAAAALVSASSGGTAPLRLDLEALEAHLAPLLGAVLAEVPASAVIPGLRRWRDAAEELLAGRDLPAGVETAWAAWRRFGEAGGPAVQMALAEATLRALPAILTGARKATDVMFPDGALHLVEAVYKANPVAARFSRTLAAAAAAFVECRRAAGHEGLRILEIGAGTGGTSEAVFAALAPHAEAIASYCYSDVSRAFLIHAERSYAARVPGLATALFDVEKPLAGQAVEAGGYDLVIAANVLHATADMRRTLAVVGETLAPGGLLLINETSQATLFTHVTFGLLDGWWRFADPEVRISGTPSLTPDSWRRLLGEAGLTWSAGSPADECALGQQLILAQAPGVTRPRAPEAPAAGSETAAKNPAEGQAPAAGGLRALLRDALAKTLNVPAESIGVDRPFADFGLDSILGGELLHRLRGALKIELPQTRLFDFATVAQLETFLRREYPQAVAALTPVPPPAPVAAPALVAAPRVTAAEGRPPIAIVGASGRFARSETIEELWAHLLAGRDLVEPVSRFDLSPYVRDAEPGSYGRHGSFLDGIDRFDPVFFGISGLEATVMDPQQRLFLEEAWKTLENAGHAGEDMVGRRCGVFVGCSHGDYLDLFESQPAGQAFWGNTSSLVPARISYWLDLKGPAVAVDTACSSSLVALHMACQSLWSGDCEMALAGGVFVQSTARFFRYANQARMLSPSGRCAAFGAGADGIVPGEAVAAVLLRPLSEALADGDHIHGVIVGSGVNQDGTTNGITAPSALSQERLIRQVQADFGIDPASIGLVEAHGTGTPLGDPIEHAALVRAFGDRGEGLPEIRLGSIKSNIGHATTAAGMAGLIKVLQCLKEGIVPPTLHFAGGNPQIAFAEGPFRVNEAAEPWPAQAGTARRAAVSSFGFSGTNAHAVVEEAPAQPATPDSAPAHLFVLSARSPGQVRQQAERLIAALDKGPAPRAGDVAFTLLVGRRHFHHRLAVVASDLDDLRGRLRAWLAGAADSAVGVAELDAQDHREDAACTAAATAEIDALAAWEAGDVTAWRAALGRVAGAYLAGCRLPYEKLFRPGRRRVPLPSYPFAAGRYWVDGPASAPTPAPATAKEAERRPGPKAAALRLAAPEVLAEAYRPAPAPLPRVRLAPLDRPVAAAEMTSARGEDGVLRLDLGGSWSAATGRRLAEELRSAGRDESLRAVLIVGGEGWHEAGGLAGAAAAELAAAPLDCPLPVVAVLTASASGAGVASALHADFLVLAEEVSLAGGGTPSAEAMARYRRRLGAEAARTMMAEGRPVAAATLRAASCGLRFAPAGEAADAGLEMARQLAEAPRRSLLELKRHMHQASPFDAADPSETQAALSALAEAAPLSPEGLARTARRLPLRSEVMELELFDDGVVLLRFIERDGRNGFTPAFMDGIEEAFAAIAELAEAKVVVLTGHDSHFASGGTREGLRDLQNGAARFTDRRIYSLPLTCALPVVAAMQGHAIGAGWSLGLFCDLPIFAAERVYHSNYLWYGFTPGAGATLIFPHRLGDDLGREVLFTAREYRGRELAGRAPGLTVLPSAEVLPAALALAHGLAVQPRARLVEAKAQLAGPLAARLESVLAQELAMHEATFIGNERVRARIEERFAGLPADPPTEAAAAAAAPPRAARRAVREKLVASLAEDLMIAAGEIRDAAGFLDLGLDSILAVTWVRRLNGLFGIELPATAVYAHPTVGALVAHVAELVGGEATSPEVVPTPAAPLPAVPSPAVQGDVRARLVASLAEDLMIAAEEIRDAAGFLELGLDSILAVTWVRRLNGLFGIELPATAVYAHPTVGALVAHVAGLLPEAAVAPAAAPLLAEEAAPAAPAVVSRPEVGAVAIIGASGRFPKAGDLEAFWDNIRAGRDCIGEVPPERWNIARHYHPDPQHPGTSYCKWMGAIDEVECFDPRFFNITPREAELMDPQQRLFLEHAWHAIEDAACDPLALAGSRCGVFAASGASGYAERIGERNAYSLLGSSGSILAARISHLLDLRGPSLSVDTACSSSLVAIAEACNSLLLGDSDLALAGGACVLIGPSMFIDTSKVNMLSKDGRCFTFDERANGFVPGEGVGVVLLKRLEEAERDGDPIRAVIRGWGVNQDGRTNGITAPNPKAQTELLRAVQERFAIDPATIGLVEAHGTGTALGDPIEIEGLTGAFKTADAPSEPLAPESLTAGSVAVGSVKSNVGHLLAAAGVAGALKAMLALERRELPPTINFARRNPHIALAGTPFAINRELKPWPDTAGGPRRAAVNAFGFSGTNAHLVLEGYERAPTSAEGGGPWLFTLSARSRESLLAYAAEMERFLTARRDLDLAALAHTLQVGRTPLPVRLAFVFAERDELLRLLASVAAGQPAPGVQLSEGDAAAVAVFEADEEARALAAKWLRSGERGKLDKLAELWAKGLTLDWRAAGPGRRLRLPGYPFARERYWVEADETSPTAEPAASAPHPLLNATARQGELARFGLAIAGDEPFLTSHAGRDERLLPGLFLPEMARAALERANGRAPRGLKHLVWGRPLTINGHAPELQVVVSADDEGQLYRVVADGRDQVPCHLGAALGDDEAREQPEPLSAEARRAGVDVGEAFRAFAASCAVHSGPPAPEAAVVREVRRDGDVLLARLSRPRGAEAAMPFDPLHLDAVWRLLAFREAGWRGKPGAAAALPFPQALREIWAEGALPDALYLRIWTRDDAAGEGALAVVLYDEAGGVRLAMTGLSLCRPEEAAEIRLDEEIVS